MPTNKFVNLKKSDLVFSFFILLHVAAAVFAIRIWPITDYPMFSLPVGEFHKISRLAIDDVFEDTVVSWIRSDYLALGLNDHRLQVYVHDVYNPRVVQIISDTVRKKDKYLYHRPKLIRLNRISVGPDSEGNLTTYKEVVREIEFEELSR